MIRDLVVQGGRVMFDIYTWIAICLFTLQLGVLIVGVISYMIVHEEGKHIEFEDMNYE